MPTKTERVHIAMDPDEIAAIDDWRRRQPSIPSRSEAIRALIRLGLERDTRQVSVVFERIQR